MIRTYLKIPCWNSPERPEGFHQKAILDGNFHMKVLTNYAMQFEWYLGYRPMYKYCISKNE